MRLQTERVLDMLVSTHSRPKAAGIQIVEFEAKFAVSTHSRPKAAGYFVQFDKFDVGGFNTQPPEGGWATVGRAKTLFQTFQHTAARRRLGHDKS